MRGGLRDERQVRVLSYVNKYVFNTHAHTVSFQELPSPESLKKEAGGAQGGCV